MLKLKQWSTLGICVLLLLSTFLTLFIALSPKAHAWVEGEKPAMCPAGTWDDWKADWAEMRSVDTQLKSPPLIGTNYLVIHAADGNPANTIQEAYVWNESLYAGTQNGESGIHFPDRSGGGYTLARFTDNHFIDTDIWTIGEYSGVQSLTEERGYELCIVAASGIVSHPDYPYTGVDISWFNYDPPVDAMAPSISSASISRQLILLRGTITFSAKTSDAQSSIKGGEFYVDVDPGKGKGTSMSYINGKISGSTLIKNLKLGKHTLYMRSVDGAGNWSKPVSKSFIYIGFSR